MEDRYVTPREDCVAEVYAMDALDLQKRSERKQPIQKSHQVTVSKYHRTSWPHGQKKRFPRDVANVGTARRFGASKIHREV
jgi:hypothetical protein